MRRLRIGVIGVWCLGGLSFPAHAVEHCRGLFFDRTPPVVINLTLAEQTVTLCFSAFAVLHSGIARTPLYAAQTLTRASVAAARTIDRVDAFHDEDRLPPAMRARLDDYVHSGFDRGHLAPAGDMPTGAAQAESFSLANIVPQDRSVNRNLWAGIEESVRRLATERGTLFVVTGPVFSGATVESINGRVLVPTDLFKAVYDPRRREGAAYLVPNRADGDWRQVPLAELAALTGVDPFPSLSPTAKAQAMTLPKPRVYDRSRERRDDDPLMAWLERQIERLLRSLWRELVRAIF